MADSTNGEKDEIETILAGWRRARPDLDLRMLGLFLRLERFDSAFRRAVEAMAKGSQVKTGELFVLLALRRTVPDHALRPTDLFRTLLVTSGAMSKRIDKLVKLGLVERVEGGGDRRSWLIRLTKPGHDLADRAIAHIASIVNRILPAGGISGGDAQRVERLIMEMHAALRRIDPSETSVAAAPAAPRRRRRAKTS
jgi:DNA-binding MarR family transcriptional regulator